MPNFVKAHTSLNKFESRRVGTQPHFGLYYHAKFLGFCQAGQESVSLSHKFLLSYPILQELVELELQAKVLSHRQELKRRIASYIAFYMIFRSD